MKLLALESSAKAASCAVFEDGQVLASAWQSAGLTHSRTLLPMVEDMLRNSGCALRDVDGIAVAAGPGSFTGLRIGVASAKGLAWGAEKPCVPVSTLEAMAWPLAHLEGVTVCAMDARRQQIYNAVFRAKGGVLERLRSDRAVSLEELGGIATALEPELYDAMPSYVRVLKENGYRTISFHGHTAELYNRDRNYPHLGFDQVLFQDAFAEGATYAGG